MCDQDCLPVIIYLALSSFFNVSLTVGYIRKLRTFPEDAPSVFPLLVNKGETSTSESIISIALLFYLHCAFTKFQNLQISALSFQIQFLLKTHI